MKKMFFALAALLLAFTACTSENEVIDTPKKEVKVTVNMDKPGFGEDSRAPRRGWEDDDQVTVVLGGYFGAYVALKYTDGEWQTIYSKFNGSHYGQLNNNQVPELIEELKSKLEESNTLKAIYFSSGLWGVLDEKLMPGDLYPERSEVPKGVNIWSENSMDGSRGECIMTCENGTFEIIENADSYELKVNIKLVPQVAQFTISDLNLDEVNYAEGSISVAGALSVYAGANLKEDGFELFSVTPNDDVWYPNATEEDWYLIDLYKNEDGVSFYASPWASGKNGIEKGTFKFSYYEYVEPSKDGFDATLVRYTRTFTGKTELKNGDTVIMDGPTTDGAESKWEVKTFDYTYD